MGETGTKTYLSLGSNIGDRLQNLEMGVNLLRDAPGVRIMRISPLYETEPWGIVKQPDFLNCVVVAMVKGGAHHLLQLCQDVETRLGRLTRGDNAPRPLDIDILVFGSEIITTPTLIIPHPRLSLRRFVLQPLADVAPNLVIPGLGQKVANLLKNCPDHSKVLYTAEVT